MQRRTNAESQADFVARQARGPLHAQHGMTDESMRSDLIRQAHAYQCANEKAALERCRAAKPTKKTDGCAETAAIFENCVAHHSSDKEISEMKAAADQMLHDRYIKQQTAQEMPLVARLNFDF